MVELRRFIRGSGIGRQVVKRELVTDKPYNFTIYTILPKRPGQKQADKEEYVVHLPAGVTLYFLRRVMNIPNRPVVVNDADFIVNDGDIGWRINTASGAVGKLNQPFGVKAAPVFTRKRSVDEHGVVNP